MVLGRRWRLGVFPADGPGRSCRRATAGAGGQDTGDGIPGTLVIVGGGKLPDTVRNKFIDLAGGSKAKLVVIPSASASADGPGAIGADPVEEVSVGGVDAAAHARRQEGQ